MTAEAIIALAKIFIGVAFVIIWVLAAANLLATGVYDGKRTRVVAGFLMACAALTAEIVFLTGGDVLR